MDCAQNRSPWISAIDKYIVGLLINKSYRASAGEPITDIGRGGGLLSLHYHQTVLCAHNWRAHGSQIKPPDGRDLVLLVTREL